MSMRSLTYQQSVFKCYHSDKHFSEFLPTRWRRKSTGTDREKLRHCHSMHSQQSALTVQCHNNHQKLTVNTTNHDRHKQHDGMSQHQVHCVLQSSHKQKQDAGTHPDTIIDCQWEFNVSRRIKWVDDDMLDHRRRRRPRVTSNTCIGITHRIHHNVSLLSVQCSAPIQYHNGNPTHTHTVGGVA